MKAELVKRQDRWDLYGEDGSKIASSVPSPLKKLSIKNCEAIANGYDLDELAKDYAINQLANPNEYEHSIYASTIQNTYMVGFQKALEILGDKKFSYFLDTEKKLGISDVKTIERIQWYYNTYFDKSQQTEFDVEIEMECVMGCQNLILNGENSVCCGDKKPKLDSDGCLILKRI